MSSPYKKFKPNPLDLDRIGLANGSCSKSSCTAVPCAETSKGPKISSDNQGFDSNCEEESKLFHKIKTEVSGDEMSDWDWFDAEKYENLEAKLTQPPITKVKIIEDIFDDEMNDSDEETLSQFLNNSKILEDVEDKLTQSTESDGDEIGDSDEEKFTQFLDTSKILDDAELTESPVKKVSLNPKTIDDDNFDDEIGESDEEMFTQCFNNFEDINKNTKPNGFAALPLEILEIIFNYLPLPTLLTKVTLVCHRWNELIRDERFLMWKKKYHKLKSYPKNDGVLTLEETKRYYSERVTASDQLSLDIIKEVKLFAKVNDRNFQMFSCLKPHRKFEGALHIVETLFPEVTNKEEHNPYCVIAAVIFLAESFNDIELVFQLVTHSKSLCDINNLLECLYYVATGLYYGVLVYNMGHSLHYKLFYTLYHYEDTRTCTLSLGQEPLNNSSRNIRERKHRLTNQQNRIIEHRLGANDVVKIMAFAGTGKTSTLVEYARNNPNMTFLNIMFNKSACEYARSIFPSNVECRTAHSLAYNAENIRGSFKFILGTLKTKDLERLEFIGPQFFDRQSRKKGNGKENRPTYYEKAEYHRDVLTTFETFINSADECVNIRHTPDCVDERERLNIVKDATLVWKKMINPRDFDVKMTHDGYLKVHQLRRPIYQGYECVMVDEAQDCNPTMLSIVLNQKVPKIFVGDPYQQIYAFRGAVNALDTIQHTHIYYLTRSFRFGPDIAFVANSVLYQTRNLRQQTLVGGKQDSYISDKRVGQVAFLGRTNSSLFSEAVRIICRREMKPGEPKDVRAYFNGGTDGLKELVEIYRLKANQFVNDRFIRKFKSYDALVNYAKGTQDIVLNGKISLINKYAGQIPQYVSEIQDHCHKYSLSNANVIFSTVHKSKGMEFDTVVLADDFSTLGFPYQSLPDFTKRDGLVIKLENEINILYVATTRAKKCLILNSALYFILLAMGELCEYPEFKFETWGGSCRDCNISLQYEPTKLILVRKNLILNDGQTAIKGGNLCYNCASITDHNEKRIRHPDEVRSNKVFRLTNHDLFKNIIKLGK